MSRSLRKAAKNVGLSLQDIFVAFAICMIIYGKRKRYSIVMDAGYAELEAERTFFIAILANAV